MQTAYANAAVEHQTPEDSVRLLVENYMDLWNRHDIEEHSKLLTEDADLVNVVGMHLRGREEIQRQHEQLHRTIFSRMVSRILHLSVRFPTDTTALVHVNWEMRGAVRLPGWNAPEPRTGVMTMLLVNQDGKWMARALHNTDTIPVPSLPGE
jgi:uncharacterized protein (TIGR02246 family)